MGSCLSVTRYGGGWKCAEENGDGEVQGGRQAGEKCNGWRERVDIVARLYATCFLFGTDAQLFLSF